MNHVLNPALRIRPVHASQLPDIAIAGAKQHLQHISRIVSAAVTRWESEGDFESPRGLPIDTNDLSIHIRSFFWETFAATDMILQWVNDALSLGLDPGQVRWVDIRSKRSKKHRQLWAEVLSVLNTYRASAEFFELATYRHLSHANFLVFQTLLSRDKRLSLVTIEVARVGQPIEDVRDQLPRYLESVSAHALSVAKLVQSTESPA